MEFYPGFDQDQNFSPMKKIKIKSKSTSSPTTEKRIEPKPLLIFNCPDEITEKLQIYLEQQLNDSSYTFVIIPTHLNVITFQYFNVNGSEEIEIEELKETILKEIKGK